jgi:hypothetical protein
MNPIMLFLFKIYRNFSPCLQISAKIGFIGLKVFHARKIVVSLDKAVI